MEVEYGEAAVNSVAFSSVDEHRMFAADSRGKCCAIDLRTSKVCGAIRGNSGSVREIEAHPTLDLVATVGLDRYVRVYNGSTRKCLGAAYAKQNLTCVAWDAFREEDRNRKKKKMKKSKKIDADSDDSDNEGMREKNDDDGILPKKRKKKRAKASHEDDFDDDASLMKAKKKKKKKTNKDVIVNYVDFDSDDDREE
jgi:ribosome biogenesis protein NSA1